MSSLLASHYGGKKGFLIAETQRMLALLGCYRTYRRIDPEHIDRLVFVCQGNICRSPFAARYSIAMGMASASFGLAATTGSAANLVGIEVAGTLGIDLSTHAATSVEDFPIRENDLLIGFEPVHSRELSSKVTDGCGAQVTLAGMWLMPPLPYIHDPYGSQRDYFLACYRRISDIVLQLRSSFPNCREER